MTLIIDSLEKESSQFPTQWVGQTEDGVGVYIRYRNHNLSVETGQLSPVENHTSCAGAISVDVDLSNTDLPPGKIRATEVVKFIEQKDGFDVEFPADFS
jgi:hypothetical protein